MTCMASPAGHKHALSLGQDWVDVSQQVVLISDDDDDDDDKHDALAAGPQVKKQKHTHVRDDVVLSPLHTSSPRILHDPSQLTAKQHTHTLQTPKRSLFGSIATLIGISQEGSSLRPQKPMPEAPPQLLQSQEYELPQYRPQASDDRLGLEDLELDDDTEASTLAFLTSMTHEKESHISTEIDMTQDEQAAIIKQKEEENAVNESRRARQAKHKRIEGIVAERKQLSTPWSSTRTDQFIQNADFDDITSPQISKDGSTNKHQRSFDSDLRRLQKLKDAMLIANSQAQIVDNIAIAPDIITHQTTNTYPDTIVFPSPAPQNEADRLLSMDEGGTDLLTEYKSKDLVMQKHVGYPPQGQDLMLPKRIEKCDEAAREIIIEHETKKERLRDLDAIVFAMGEAAKAYTSRVFQSSEHKEVRVLKEYVLKVLSERLSGKMKRPRIRQIGDGMKRRHQKDCVRDCHIIESASVEKTDAVYERLLTREFRQQIDREREELDNQIDNLGSKRRQIVKRFASKDHEKKSSVKKARSSAPKRTASGPPGPLLIQQPKTTKKSDRVSAQTLEERANQIRAQITAFEDPKDKMKASKHTGEEVTTEPVTVVNFSDESEEEEGQEYYAGAHTVEEYPTKEVTEHSQNVSSAITESSGRLGGDPECVSSQKPDDSLIKSMNMKQQMLQRHQNMQEPYATLSSKVDKHTATSNTIFESEFDVGDSDDESVITSDDMKQPICYRYSVKGYYIGFAGRQDEFEYCHGRYLSDVKANNMASSEISNIAKVHTQSPDYSTDKVVRIQEEITTEGLKDCHIGLGIDERMTCRIWVEKEEYSPSSQAYEDARVKRACQIPPVYMVLWEKIVTPIVEEEVERHNYESLKAVITDLDEENQNHDGVVDSDPSPGKHTPSLASAEGDSSSVPSLESSLQPIVTSPTPLQLRLATNIAQANRFAKERFMAWWLPFLRGEKNHHHIRHGEQLMEDQLQAFGNLTTWEWEDNFDTEMEDGTPVTESLRVWVEEKKVYGPGN